jgi:hypothetical protein
MMKLYDTEKKYDYLMIKYVLCEQKTIDEAQVQFDLADLVLKYITEWVSQNILQKVQIPRQTRTID